MKRTKEYVEQSNLKEVYVPFRNFIPAGHSLFTVQVPLAYAKRDFFFSYLVLVPDFYSLQAALFKLDTDEELNVPIPYSLHYKINLQNETVLHPDSITIPVTTIIPYGIAKDINEFFETKRPMGTTHLGMFFDWYDLRFDEVEDLTWDEYVREITAIEYYGVDFNEKLHFNKLPPSARSVLGANNYLFPTSMSEELYKHLRWRINLAPMVDGLFSTPSQLFEMGFTLAQLGNQRRYKNKFVIENDSKTNFMTLMGQNIPERILTNKYQLIVSLKSHLSTYSTHPIEFSLTKEESLKNSNYAKKIKNVLLDYNKESNFIMGFNYNDTTKKFSFVFPDNPVLNYNIVEIPLELSERLGFDFVTDIKKTANTGEEVNDSFDIKEAETKARALAYDTSVVIISHSNSSANTTAGINSSYMAALYPSGFGTLEISPVEACFKPPLMKLPITLYGTPVTVPATFKLSRFLDNNELTNLIWTNGAYIFGVLRGIEPDIKV